MAEVRSRVLSFYALDVARSITGHVPDYEVLAREAELAGASRLAWPAPRDVLKAIDDADRARPSPRNAIDVALRDRRQANGFA